MTYLLLYVLVGVISNMYFFRKNDGARKDLLSESGLTQILLLTMMILIVPVAIPLIILKEIFIWLITGGKKK